MGDLRYVVQAQSCNGGLGSLQREQEGGGDDGVKRRMLKRIKFPYLYFGPI